MPLKEHEILRTKDVWIRIIELAPHEEGKWHLHSEVDDNFFGHEGTLLVRTRDRREEVRLSPGTHFVVAKGRVHQVVNPNEVKGAYLLIQGVGAYDFVAVDQ